MPKIKKPIPRKPSKTVAHEEVSEFLSGGSKHASAAKYVRELMGAEAVTQLRRKNRKISTAHARDLLYAEHFIAMARPLFEGRIQASGYAKRHKETIAKRQGVHREIIKRHVTLMLSDLHVGAKMPGSENPYQFDFLCAGRRLASILQQVLGYKKQYRAQTQLNLVFNGDLIDGMLKHDEDDGEPLPLQKLAALHFFERYLAELSAAFPFVVVHWQCGNHGRDIARHPGRALNAKWAGHEGELGMVLRMMTRNLPNVTWHFDRKPWSIIELPGDRRALATHGDTEMAIPSPGKNLSGVRKTLMHINGTRMYCDRPVDVLLFGHWHEPCLIAVADNQWAVSNGSLVPPNGYARSLNATSPNMQALFESVADHPVGDFRWLRVGVEDDKNAELDKLIPPFVSPI